MSGEYLSEKVEFIQMNQRLHVPMKKYYFSQNECSKLNGKNNVYFGLQSMASDTSQMQCQRRFPSTSGLFTWIRIFRFADSLMRQGC